MNGEPAFGWIEPLTVDRGLSWARAVAGEAFSRYGDSATVQEEVRRQVQARAPGLNRAEVDAALAWSAERARYLRERVEAEHRVHVRRFEVRAQTLLQDPAAGSCASRRLQLLSEADIPQDEAAALLDQLTPCTAQQVPAC